MAFFEKSISSLVTICKKNVEKKIHFGIRFCSQFNLTTARFGKRSNIISHLFAS